MSATHSSVPFPGVRTPAAGFDEPFAMLAACHERVTRSLDLLGRLVAHVQTVGVDTSARAAAHDVWRYFELAAPAHHTDEELHVMPRLRATGDPVLTAVARRMQADHDELRALWRQLGPRLAALHDADDAPTADALQVLAELADAFVARHRRHLALEDDVAFPRARPLIGVDDERAVGDEMARRRQAGG